MIANQKQMWIIQGEKIVRATLTANGQWYVETSVNGQWYYIGETQFLDIALRLMRQ